MSRVTSLIDDLKSQRNLLGWSLDELACRSGIDECSLAEWEHGMRSPALDAVERWAAALGMRLIVQAQSKPQEGGVRIDWETRRITVDGAPVRLTPMEWRALERLARTPGELVSHQALYRHLYGEERSDRAQSTAVRVLMTKLRRLLPLRIEARWGQGYIVSGIEPPRADDGAAKGRETPPAVGRPAEVRIPIRAAAAAAAPERIATLAHRPAVTQIRRDLARPCEHETRRASVSLCRSDEIGIIDRFLAERGATRCPDAATIEKSPLPTLVWDKVKRKWVRPVNECNVG